jgi:toxin YoeB
VKVFWTPEAWTDYLNWRRTDLAMVGKIDGLIHDIRRSPFAGLGKPEPLRGVLSGWWSRRITAEHRLVYRVLGKGRDQRLEIAQCRYHY